MNQSQKGKAKYNLEVDVFAAHPLERKYDSSTQIGNLIFDLDKKGRINGIEILNASNLFNIPKVFLKNMISCKLKIKVANKMIYVEARIMSVVRNANKMTILNLERISPDSINPTELKIAVASC